MHTQQKKGKEIFAQLRQRLVLNDIILESAIQTEQIKYSQENIQKCIDLSKYISDYYHLLANVPGYVSDNSYVLNKIPNIKSLISELNEIQKKLRTAQLSDLQYNIQVQLLSKMFSQKSQRVKLIRYIYGKVFGEWLKPFFAEKNIFDYMKQFPLLADEGFQTHDVRVLGQALYEKICPLGSKQD